MGTADALEIRIRWFALGAFATVLYYRLRAAVDARTLLEELRHALR